MKLIDSAYSQVENFSSIVHTNPGESEPFMAPDESYLIFFSSNRPGGFGGTDLWICFRKTDSTWTVPVNMGSNINTNLDENGPRVTKDGKYLFFTRDNGINNMDIYWVSANIIDSLKSIVISVNSTGEQVPDKCDLQQNFPNPFNPNTTIRYSIFKNSYVDIKIHNILGKEIATPVNSFQKCGTYDIVLNMNDLNLSSGFYFYTLTATEASTGRVFRETKVMSYIK